MFLVYLFSALLSFSLALYLTPKVAETALKTGIVDKPDSSLKTHEKVTPYLGGLVIYVSFILTLGFTIRFDVEIFAILLSSTIILVLGLIDDIGALSPGVKMLGQLIAVFIIIKGGIYIKLIFLPEWISFILTFLWLLGITNAVNIIDIKDGLATGVIFVASLFLFVISVTNENLLIAVLTITLVGSLLGFLRYNWQPASIYLGDAGSMFIGFMLGALTINGSYTQNNDISALAPVLLLGVPIFDTVLVSIVRLRKGMSPLLGSPDHFAHRLLKIGWSLNKIVLVSYFVSLILGVTVLIVMSITDVIIATVIVLAVFTIGLILVFMLACVRMTE